MGEAGNGWRSESVEMSTRGAVNVRVSEWLDQ